MSLDIKICLASKGIAMTSSVGDTVNVEYKDLRQFIDNLNHAYDVALNEQMTLIFGGYDEEHEYLGRVWSNEVIFGKHAGRIRFYEYSENEEPAFSIYSKEEPPVETVINGERVKGHWAAYIALPAHFADMWWFNPSENAPVDITYKNNMLTLNNERCGDGELWLGWFSLKYMTSCEVYDDGCRLLDVMQSI